MRRFRLIIQSLILVAFFAVSAFAQTTGDKIGLLNWAAFSDPKDGITKFTAALTTLNNEFKVIETELQTMSSKYQTLKTELEGFQKLLNENKPVPIPQSEIQKKIDQLGQMERDMKFKQEDAKARYQSRYNILVAPVEGDIYKAVSEFAAQKGYAVILDGVKLEQANVLLGFAPKADITKDFIAFYNARPTPTASK